MISLNNIISLFATIALATVPAAVANTSKSIRSRHLVECDTLEGCYLMNAKTLTVITKLPTNGTAVTSYVLDPMNDIGYSIRCNAKGNPGASFDYFTYKWDGMSHIEWLLPAYMYGSSDAGKYINPVPYLGTCGMKTVDIEGHIWVQQCLRKTIVLDAKRADGQSCNVTAPISAPAATMAPAPATTKAPASTTTKSPTRAPRRAPRAPPVKSPVKPPTKAPTKTPTTAPTKMPTRAPRRPPRTAPVKAPTKSPTLAPTKAPTSAPTKTPTRAPRRPRTAAPVKSPAKVPTKTPTKSPTKSPTKVPVKAPTKAPVKAPTKAPVNAPTPTNTDIPPVTAPTTVVCRTLYIVKDGKCVFAPIRWLLQQ